MVGEGPLDGFSWSYVTHDFLGAVFMYDLFATFYHSM